tara:strand:- start:128 stop:343 length:216 start_codon:yes stop_codon:yes gene_type:complete
VECVELLGRSDPKVGKLINVELEQCITVDSRGFERRRLLAQADLPEPHAHVAWRPVVEVDLANVCPGCHSG